MAWTRELESGGEAQGQPTGWWTDGKTRVQFDPSNPGFTTVDRGEAGTEQVAWAPQAARSLLNESAYLGLAAGDKSAAEASVSSVMSAAPGYWADKGVTPASVVADSEKQNWRRLTNQDDDNSLGTVLGIAALAAAIYSGGAAMGAWGGEAAAAGGAMDMGVGLGEVAQGFGVTPAAEPSLMSRIAGNFTPEKIAQKAGTELLKRTVSSAISDGPQSALMTNPYGYQPKATAAIAQAAPVVNSVPTSFAMAISPFDPKFQRI